MQLQATYKQSQDSLKLLERLNDIDELRGANVRIYFNSRSPEDQKLLKQLMAAARGKRRFSPELLKTVGLATMGSAGVIAYGLFWLFGFG